MDMNHEELEAAQVAFSVASRLVYVEPSDAEVQGYLEPGLFAEAPFGGDDAAVANGLRLMDGWCAGVRDAVAAGDGALADYASDLRRDWLNLLVGIGEPKAPSWAGYYLNPNASILGESALEVRRLYKRHGFQLERQNQEPDDNLGIMLEFMSLLIGLELEGDAEGTSDAAASAADCQKQLLQRYILPWLPLWHWSVERFAKTDFYRGVGDLVFGLVRTYATRFGFRYTEEGDNPHFVLG